MKTKTKLFLTGLATMYVIGATYAMKTAETVEGYISPMNNPAVTYNINNDEHMQNVREMLKQTKTDEDRRFTFTPPYVKTLGIEIGDKKHSVIIHKHDVREGETSNGIYRNLKKEEGLSQTRRNLEEDLLYKKLNTHFKNPNLIVTDWDAYIPIIVDNKKY